MASTRHSNPGSRRLGKFSTPRLKRIRSRADRFEALVRPHFDAMYGAARRMTGSTADAEDLVQEVCVKAYQRLDELEQMDYQRAWLLKVIYHQFIDLQRSRERSPVDLSDTGSESAEPDGIGETSSQPDELVDREMHMQKIVTAMGYLRKDHCALVALHDVEGLTLDELHQLTGIPVGTIKAQLHRTRAKLGRLLSNNAVMKPHLKLVGGKP